MALLLNLQRFAEPTEPEPTDPVVLDLPLEGEQPTVADTVQQAQESVVAAMTQVKQIEIEGLSAVISTLNEVVSSVKSLNQEVQATLQMANDLKMEALELVEALKVPQEKNQNESTTPQNDVLPQPSEKERKGFLSIL